MSKILIGFVPWILYFVLTGATQSRIDWAIIISFVALFVLSFHELKKGFILTCGTLLFFTVMLVMVVILQNHWMMQNKWILSNATLAAISWFSLIIKKPFTLQYAREQVDERFWQSPLFIRINNIITLVWAVVFTICVLINIDRTYLVNMPMWLYQTLTNGLPLLAILFTAKFPNYYRNHLIEKLKQKTANNPFLQGNFAPVKDELSVKNLQITGEIPTYLSGAYMRNGPNPAFDPISYTYPYDGDGMIHAVYIDNCKAKYKNRYVQTDALTVEQRAGKALYGGILKPIVPDKKYLLPNEKQEEFKNGAFINIIQQQNQLLALFEGDCAYTLDFKLKTTGKWCPDKNDPIHVGPHPRLDPSNGERWFINYALTPPYVELYCFDVEGKKIKYFPIETKHSIMIHDFVLTKRFAIFFLCPVVFDISAAYKGEDMISWRPELGTKIGVVSRDTGSVEWFTADPFFVFHFANAYEEGNEIIIDYVRHSKFNVKIDTETKSIFSLMRTTINLLNKTVHHSGIESEHVIEFPRIREDRIAHKHRYIYFPKKDNSNFFNSLVKFDMQTRSSTEHQFGNKVAIDEAVFVAKSSTSEEDEGCLLFFAYDQNTNNSDLVILNARDIAAEPLARIRMPRRVPHGLHGNWISL